MKRILAFLALSLSLGGCFLTTSVDVNTSVSRNTLLGIESAYGIALSAERSYKTVCIQRVIEYAKCRPIVVRLQAADLKAIASIKAANSFIRTYPTLDASNVISAAQTAVAVLQAILKESGAS